MNSQHNCLERELFLKSVKNVANAYVQGQLSQDSTGHVIFSFVSSEAQRIASRRLTKLEEAFAERLNCMEVQKKHAKR